nr:MAG TPA: hypothetical protein [Caudoviricetes sp.]
MHNWKNCRHSCELCRDNRQPLQRGLQATPTEGAIAPSIFARPAIFLGCETTSATVEIYKNS